MVGLRKVSGRVWQAGVGSTTAFEILAALKAESVDKLAELVGGESDAIKEVKTLFAVAAE